MTAAIALAPSPLAIVPRVSTPIDAGTAAAHLRAWPETDGASGPLFLALVFVETGGGKSTHNNNPGNVTASERYNGEAFRPGWFELGPNPTPKEQALHDRMLAGTAPKAFRSYADFGAGFSDLHEQLRRNFASVLAAAQSGSARNFVDALSERYSKDYNSAHYAAFEQLQNKFQPLFVDLPRRSSSASMAAGGGSLFLVGLAAWALYRASKRRTQWQAY